MAFTTYRPMPFPRHTLLCHCRSERLASRIVRPPRGSFRCKFDEVVQKPVAQVASASSKKLATFNWSDQWYALTFARDVDHDEPHAFRLFDTPLVLYRKSANEFAVLEDRCPHRLAPLSEGRVMPTPSGERFIQCAYHGWSFKSCGTCACIPQNPPNAPIPRRASVKSYPTVVAIGLVWVWFGDPIRADKSKLPLPSLAREFREDELILYMNVARVVPYGAEALLENLADPVHVHWAHHKARNYFDRARGGEGNGVRVIESGPLGIVAKYKTTTLRYIAPITVIYDVSEWFNAMFTITPISRRRSRLLLVEMIKKSGPLPRSFRAMIRRPRWQQHIEVLTTTDGDNWIVRSAEEALGNDVQWREKYLPINSDGLVLGVRSWMDYRRASMPWKTMIGEEDEILSGDSIIERLQSHTAECKSCTMALKRWRTAQTAVNWAINFVSMFVAALTGSYVGVVGITGDMFDSNKLFENGALGPMIMLCVALASVVLLLVRLRRVCTWHVEQFTVSDEAKRLIATQ